MKHHFPPVPSRGPAALCLPVALFFQLALAVVAAEIEIPPVQLPLETPEARKLMEGMETGDLPAVAGEAAKLAKRLPDNIELWHILGNLQAEMGDYDEALVSLAHGLREKDSDLSFLTLMARIHEDRARLGPGGKRAGGMVSYQPSKMAGQDQQAFKADQLRLAAEKFQQILRLHPEVKLYQAKRVSLLLAAGDAAGAFAASENYLKEGPDHAGLLLQHARAAEALQRWAEAGEAAQRCAALQPADADTCAMLARLAARDGHTQEAEAWERKARYHAFVPSFLSVPYGDEVAARIAPLCREADGEDEEKRKAWIAAAKAAIAGLVAEKSEESSRLLAIVAWHHAWHGPVEEGIYAELEARRAEGALMALFDRANSFCTVGSCAPALARLGSETAFPLIIERLPMDRNMFGMNLPEALVIYGRPEAVEPLARALKDSIVDFRRSLDADLNPMAMMGTGAFVSRCMWALAEFKTTAARQSLQEVAADKSFGAEATAALFLQTREKAYYTALLKLLRKDPAEARAIGARYKAAGLAGTREIDAIAAASEKKKKRKS